MTAWSSTAGAEVSSERSALINAVRVVRERWWLILTPCVVCFLLSLALALHSQKQYTATAALLVKHLTASAQGQLVAGQARLQSELAQLPATDPSRTALQQGLEQVIALQAVTNGGAQVVEQAGVPGAPSTPRVKRDAVIGAAVGLLIGLALAFLLDLFDRRIKSGE